MTSLPPPTTAPAGWYPDPSGIGTRYFDGRAWGPRSAPVPVFEQKPPHQRLPLPAALGALLVLVGSLVFGRAVVALFADSERPVDVVLSVLVGYGPSLVWCWYVLRRWTDGRLGAIGWTFRWGDLWRGPATYLTAIGIQIVIAALLLLLDVPISSNIDEGESRATLGYKIAIVIVTVVAAPIVEEIIFRGVVLRGLLSRMGPVPAIVIQGTLFGVAHVDPSRGSGNIGLAVVLSSVGIVFGAAAYLTRRIAPTVIAHAIFNGVVMILLLSGVLDDVDTDFGGRTARSAVTSSELVVVDQAHVIEPHGDHHHPRTIHLLERFERGSVDDLDVVDACSRFGVEYPAGGSRQCAGVTLACGVQVDR
jgi:membrane protease YdiL (CAAX protease family)